MPNSSVHYWKLVEITNKLLPNKTFLTAASAPAFVLEKQITKLSEQIQKGYFVMVHKQQSFLSNQSSLQEKNNIMSQNTQNMFSISILINC